MYTHSLQPLPPAAAKENVTAKMLGIQAPMAAGDREDLHILGAQSSRLSGKEKLRHPVNHMDFHFLGLRVIAHSAPGEDNTAQIGVYPCLSV